MKKKIWNSHDWENMKILYPNRKHLKLKDLDKIPYYDENNKIIDHFKNERIEQYISNDYITPNMCVLELGGRYGTVSCVINNKLENPKNHVVFEPDKTVIPALIKNRKNHKSKFTIFNGVISNKPVSIVYDGYATKIIETKTKIKKNNEIKTWSLNEIIKKTNLHFNCLVADCEGCLESFFKENLDYIKNFELIIFEKDMPNICNYTFISNKLLEFDFICLNNNFVSVWKKK